MNVYLIDGTYELFRHFFALPSATDTQGREIGAVRGVVASVIGMLEEGVTHLGVATDHVIESFRNRLYTGYKTGGGIDPRLLAQFAPLEEALESLGVRVWAMVDEEADDALAAAASKAGGDDRVGQVFICTPDKDLAQCVRNGRIVQLDRRRNSIRDEAGVRRRFGVAPESIPDYLALVGDSADGFPGLPGWGPRSSGVLLGRYIHLEAIPADPTEWQVQVRGAAKLAATLRERWNDAVLFRKLATLRTDYSTFESVDELRWAGPGPGFGNLCRAWGAGRLEARTLALTRNV